MQKHSELRADRRDSHRTLPVSVIIPVRNEAENLPRCLDSVREFAELFVIDSQSTDATVEIAQECGAEVVQFYYRGGWPKKRQWAMDSLPIASDWILLLDADEALTPELIVEIRTAIRNPDIDACYLSIQMQFLGRSLRHGGASFEKLCLFRRGKARFECRLENQDTSMCDMEVHEHVVATGKTARLKHPVLHHNIHSLARYIDKHNQYSNWEARVWLNGSESSDLSASLLGAQAQRRRWLKQHFLRFPGSSACLFIYRYLFRFGFLDGIPGLIYCSFQAIQLFQVKAKMFEIKSRERRTISVGGALERSSDPSC